MTKLSESLWIQLIGFLILGGFAIFHRGLPLLLLLGVVLLACKKDFSTRTKLFARISGGIMLGVGIVIMGIIIWDGIRTGDFREGLIACGTILSDFYWDNLWLPLVRLLSL